jgi:Fibronectin type III domain
MVLSWKAPEHDGGSGILGYHVEKRDTFMNMWSQVGKVDKDTLGIRVSGLFEGQSYLFRVAAENQCGRGEFVETVKSVTAKLPFGKAFREYLLYLKSDGEFMTHSFAMSVHLESFWF